MLSDNKCKNAKSTEKAYRLPDGEGLYLRVAPSGAKTWQYRYKTNGKESILSIGPYPAVSLADARKAKEKAQAERRGGRDPNAVKKLQKVMAAISAENTFEPIAREWHERQKGLWSPRHIQDVMRGFEKEVFPYMGGLPIDQITAPEVLAVLRLVEARGAVETVTRIRQRISSVFVYAIATGRATSDPSASLEKAFTRAIKRKQPAVTSIEALRKMLRAVEATPGHPVTKLAIRILAITAVRPGTLATTPWAEWQQETLDDGLWQIPSERMKLKLSAKGDERRDHLCPLPRQAVDAIGVLRQLSGTAPYAFPNSWRRLSSPMSENAMGYLLNRAGYHRKHVPHGFRASFSTIMNETYPADRAVIDMMLAHVPKNEVEAAYNRALYLERRRELSQLWADMIMDDAPDAAALLNLPKRINKV
ncbi:tyrosine-type recombinase/integrase [Agrobacterium vitis]|uniref:tyrosine-type recombinase/integrase n=1 Tax=Agrobacterium vitis TaxID=373 RepID=UPI0008726A81|nr:integrase arm-type DNA-binding domain-containing protein [Agrobacterium vitis]MCM2471131.1 integrase arm-type DNA-binding domain-containing protein [Agrobacterium vitis]MUO70124.1 DUF4102 domain-containing protein [Agrobacterium vitis]